jgi:beta-carotene 15,15'-dioxygenase
MITMSLARNLSRQSAVFCTVAIVAILTNYVFDRWPQRDELWIAITLIALLGVPHGALDTHFGQRIYALRGIAQWALFCFAYVAIASMVVALWWFWPLTFLVLFLWVSVLHFSGDLLLGTNVMSRLLYGAAIIVLPNFFYAEEVLRLFTFLAPDSSSAGGLQQLSNVLRATALAWGGALLLCAVYEARRSSQTAIEMIAVAAIALCTPPLIAFTVYFCAMHGVRHVLRTLDHVPQTLRKSLLLSVTMVMVVVLVLAVSTYSFSMNATVESTSSVDMRLVQVVFVGLAALTVPHMMLIERVRFFGWRE